MNSGQRVRYLRSLKRLSRTSFSEEYGIPSSTLRNWEMSDSQILRHKAALTLFDKLSDESTVTLDWLIYGTGNDPKIKSKSSCSFETMHQAIVDAEQYIEKYGPDEHIIRFAPDNSWSPFIFSGDIIIARMTDLIPKKTKHLSIFIDVNMFEYIGVVIKNEGGVIDIKVSNDGAVIENLSIDKQFIIVRVSKVSI
ncbi:helix-turn-helix domain-containing protein [Dongshaea marina]|uniref:helix-turn-helix domain-containing protein n=1 Tax=Dongshaea marina TaxID=2047966 RepID=UPI00131F2E97|nr:helix-turn-helix transcriptional regulator [Dongshaea marina]